MMLGSREAVVDYMTPLGLASLMDTGHHYGPGPWVSDCRGRNGTRLTTIAPMRTASALTAGTRRAATRSRNTRRRSRRVFADPKKTPENLLLWFHHLSWDHRMPSGRTLWDELVFRYDHGVEVVSQMRQTWNAQSGRVDAERFAQVAAFLAIQEQEAKWWRDACIAYFQSFSKRPLPAGARATGASARVLPVTQVSIRARARLRFLMRAAWWVCAWVAGAVAAAAAVPPPVELTAEQDHGLMMEKLGLSQLRQGANGRDPNAPNAANYDESKAQSVSRSARSPDAGERQTGEVREGLVEEAPAPRLVELFDREIYGRTPQDIPAVNWEVRSTTNEKVGDTEVVVRKLVGRVDNSSYPAISVEIDLTLTTPAGARSVPVIIEFFPVEWASRIPPQPKPTWQEQVIARGWAYAILSPSSIQADNGAGLTQGHHRPRQQGPAAQARRLGCAQGLGLGCSRALDYLETNPEVDAKRAVIEGVSRYGKASLVTLAYEPRFAMGFIGSSGAGGAALARRNWGEKLENVAASGEYHWMAGNYIKYAADPLTVKDLPVDAHELIALCAPRPVFIGAGTLEKGDGWVDPKGMFLAAAAAGPGVSLVRGSRISAPPSSRRPRLRWSRAIWPTGSILAVTHRVRTGRRFWTSPRATSNGR